MEPVISPLELALGLIVFNGIAGYRLYRALHRRAGARTDVRRTAIYAVGLLVVVNALILGLTGYLWLCMTALLTGSGG